MSEAAIQVRGLGKRYRLGSGVNFNHTLPEAIGAKVQGLLAAVRLKRRGASPTESQDFWALRDIDFDVDHGEVVGIIGCNGAGKSTLLKILSQITDPSEGHATVNGRVASLLEVGTGFHPELTGRENIFLNGSILGMTRQEIKSKFDEIVDFSGVEKFLDTPVKRYSSGMMVRLAFAVAAHLEPEILIVDEVLAVGDAAFQSKCLGKMQEVASGQGRTVLFVSHNLNAVQSLCGRAVLLDQGRSIDIGTASHVISTYRKRCASGCSADGHFFKDPSQYETSKDIEFVSLDLTPIDRGDGPPDMLCTVKYVVRKPRVGSVISVMITNSRDVAVMETVDTDTNQEIFVKNQALYTSRCIIPASIFVPDDYYITLSAADMKGTRFDYKSNLVSFSVNQNIKILNTYRRNGVISAPIAWETIIDKQASCAAPDV